MHATADLKAIARQTAIAQGFIVDPPDDVTRALGTLAPDVPVRDARDLRALPWSSIDDRTSRDLDQLEVAEELDGGAVRVRIAIADVDSLVPKDSPVDRVAAHNATSVYTGVAMFPMLPEVLSTDRTSLRADAERAAVIIEMTIDATGVVTASDVYLALVTNHAKLAYDDVAAWLDGTGQAPAAMVHAPGMDMQLRLQARVAQQLRARRLENGALEFDSVEARTVVGPDGEVKKLEVLKRNPARELVEDFMIAANGVMAVFLATKGVSSIRRVVRAPERWNRIVALAAEHGTTLPPAPDAIALSHFLAARRAADPERFPDLSLSIVKLMGPGEYVMLCAGEMPTGHFGLAVDNYTHATAPNRRFADLVTQRLLKAALSHSPAPYTDDELATIAQRCTEREDAARKVERTMRKVVAATLLATHVGDTYEAIVTGASPKGTYVRLLAPPAEGRVVEGERGMDVGDKVRVRLVGTDVPRGFIDFARA